MKLLIFLWIVYPITTALVEPEEDSDDNSLGLISIGPDIDYSFTDTDLLDKKYGFDHGSKVLGEYDDDRISENDSSENESGDDLSNFEDFTEKDDEIDHDDEEEEEVNDSSYAIHSEEKEKPKNSVLAATQSQKKGNDKPDKSFPPPYMINRINFIDTCNKEAKYYLSKHCPNCPAKCCLARYRRICKSGFRFYDSSLSARKEKAKDGTFSSSSKASKCSQSCKTYHSFVIASIKCRKKVRISCTYLWTLLPYFIPPPHIKLCCGLRYYATICLPAWNDQKLYELPKLDDYLEVKSPICQLLQRSDFNREACNRWLLPDFVNMRLKEVFAPPGLNKFNETTNCTIIKQSKEKQVYP
ncbi:hypothetical protein TYRP_016672 [Tyrophagus putrescentiae]|nr:hypothetical protein TYRP_016672 [Tyrophagus putrescentiae]